MYSCIAEKVKHYAINITHYASKTYESVVMLKRYGRHTIT